MTMIQVFQDREHLADAAARRVLEIGDLAISRNGVFTLVLSGGTTPLPVYRNIRQQKHALNWRRVHVFWGDERCLAPDDPLSNYAQASEMLLNQVAMPAENVHRMKGELQAEPGARDYQAQLRSFFAAHPALGRQELVGGRFPVFDLILLGMGDDGHTASLFPGSPALDETTRWVIGVQHNQPPPPLVDRISFTLPLINSAAQVIFLVSGESKAKRLQQVFAEQTQQSLPAGRIKPASGQLEWLVDSAAASALSEVLS